MLQIEGKQCGEDGGQEDGVEPRVVHVIGGLVGYLSTLVGAPLEKHAQMGLGLSKELVLVSGDEAGRVLPGNRQNT